MRAALLYDRQDLRLEEFPTPAAGSGEILLRTAAACICGTDVRMLQHGHRHATPATPLIIGHEMSGTIAAVGAGVSGLRPGQRVSVAPNYNPASSPLVARGEGHLDPGYRALGIHDHGAFAEFVRIPAAAVEQGNVLPIPDDMSFAAAALVEPLACVYNGQERARIQRGEVVLIFGAGPIGIMHAKLARLADPGRVIVADVNADRLAFVRSLDPGWITVAGDPRDEIMRLTGGAGADVIITACPVPAVQAQAIELAAINGRVIFFGGLPASAAVVPLDTNLIHYRQLIVSGTTRHSLRQYRATLELLATRRVEVEDLITATHGIERIEAAMSDAVTGRGMKTRIEFD